MNPAPYTEDTLVQQTTADYLDQQLGWESIYTYNVEDFGPNRPTGPRLRPRGSADALSVRRATLVKSGSADRCL